MTPETDRADGDLSHEIRTSCMNAAELIEYFADSMEVPVDRLTDGLRVDVEFLKNTANWIDNEDTYRLYYNCHHALPGFSHRDWYEVGQASYGTNAPGYFKLILKLIAVKAIYAGIPTTIERTSKVSEYRIIESRPGHVRFRYAIPNREVALNYTIGSECWYHLGILSALPKFQSDKSSFAATDHELCSMPAGHILENCYEVYPPDYEYTDEGLVVYGRLLGRWVCLEPFDGTGDVFSRDYTIASRKEANALLIVRELEIQGVHAFLQGEIYDAPHCLFDIRYEPQPLVRRLAGVLRPGARYYEEQLRKTEQLFLDFHKLRYEEERLEQTLKTIAGDAITAPSRIGSASPEMSLELTRREREIADRVALGLTNGDIADELFISTETVKRHMHNIFAKIGVKNRVQLVRWLRGEVT